LTKTAFIARADTICQRNDARQAAKYKTYSAAHSAKELSTQAGEEQIVLRVGLPSIRLEIDELSRLGAPVGDERQVSAILDEAEGAVNESEENPRSVLDPSGGPFQGTEKLAREYGLKSCGIT
jgi:hypothetical protein